MKRLLTAVVVAALALATVPGCGPSGPGGPNSPGGAKDGKDPSEPSASGPAVSLQQFLAGLPADAVPKNTDDTVRIDRANDWLKANAPGKRIACDYALIGADLNRVGDTRSYSVTFYGTYTEGDDIFPKKNIVKVNGVPWAFSVGNQNNLVVGMDIALSDVPEDVADQLSGLKNKVVKLTATVTGASFTGKSGSLLGEGYLAVRANRFVLNGIKTGLALALDRLKAAADPAARKAAIDVVMRKTPRAGDAKETLTGLADLLKDKDEGVRQAAALATAALDPNSKVDPGLIPRKASLDGKLIDLVRVLYVPESEQDHGKTEVHDDGVSGGRPDYSGYKKIPAGHWVYLYPYWYVWHEATAVDHLKAAADPAARRAAIDEVMGQSPRAEGSVEVLAALADVLKDKDQGVRQAAALAMACLDPKRKIDPASLPRKASLDGKLTKLLRVLYIPEDADQYGTADVKDDGVESEYADYKGYKNIPAGHWVWLDPYWYVWQEPK